MLVAGKIEDMQTQKQCKQGQRLTANYQRECRGQSGLLRLGTRDQRLSRHREKRRPSSLMAFLGNGASRRPQVISRCVASWDKSQSLPGDF